MGPRRTMAKNGAGVVTGGSRTLAHDILNRLPLSISYNQAISGFTIGKTEFLSIRQRHCWIGPNPAIRSMSISQMGEKNSGQIRFFIRSSQKNILQKMMDTLFGNEPPQRLFGQAVALA